MKLKIRRVPRIRKNKKKKYKFAFNAKLKINCLTKKRNEIYNTTRNSLYRIRFSECCQMRYFNIKKIRLLLLRIMKRHKIHLWFYAHFFIPLTAKPLLRMGTGKGKFRCFVAKYRKGDTFLEFSDNFINLYHKKKFFKILRCVIPAHAVLVKNYN